MLKVGYRYFGRLCGGRCASAVARAVRGSEGTVNEAYRFSADSLCGGGVVIRFPSGLLPEASDWRKRRRDRPQNVSVQTLPLSAFEVRRVEGLHRTLVCLLTAPARL